MSKTLTLLLSFYTTSLINSLSLINGLKKFTVFDFWMTHLHREVLLMVLKNHISPEMRQILMRECPAAYNDWCGRTVVGSHVIDTGSVVIKRPETEESFQ